MRARSYRRGGTDEVLRRLPDADSMIYFCCPACGIHHESGFQVPQAIYEARNLPGVGDLEIHDECPNTVQTVTYMLSEANWWDR